MTLTPRNPAILFPGQGAQQPGMGAWLLDTPAAERVFGLASRAVGRDLAALCRQGAAEELRQTELAQPALLAVGLTCWSLLRERGLEPGAAAGHSLGEYGAWVVAGALDEQTVFPLIAQRARLMGAAAAARPGGMAAVVGLPAAEVEAICREAATAGVIVPSNYNGPGQTVVSGEPAAVARARELVAARGGKVLPVAVNGAFHSPLMAEAAEAFAKVVESVALGQVTAPVAANHSGAIVADQAAAREAMAAQMTSAVRWQAQIEALVGAGVSRFLEMSPGRTLAGLVRRIAPEVEVIPVDSPEALDKALESGAGGA